MPALCTWGRIGEEESHGCTEGRNKEEEDGHHIPVAITPKIKRDAVTSDVTCRGAHQA
jgi:hypothetical protein